METQMYVMVRYYFVLTKTPKKTGSWPGNSILNMLLNIICRMMVNILVSI